MEKISNASVSGMKESKGFMSDSKDKMKKIVVPTAVGMFMSFFPINIDSSSNANPEFQQVFAAEKGENGIYSELRHEYPNIYRKPALQVEDVFVNHSSLGKVATDGFSVTHVLDKDGKYNPLESNVLLEVSPKERIDNVLNYLVRYEYGKANPDKKTTTRVGNPYNIDVNEVAEYAKSGKEGNSFVVAKNSKNEPCLIIATDPFSKLNKTDGGVDHLMTAISNLNKYDPEIIDLITRDYLVRIISGNSTLFNLNHKSKVYQRGGAILYNNQEVGKTANVIGHADYYLISLLMQSRAIGHLRNTRVNPDQSLTPYLADRLSENAEIDATMWTLDWLKKHKNNIPGDKYNKYLNFTSEIHQERLKKFSK